MKRWLVQTVLHQNQRYPTVGDYVEGHGFVVVTVSDLANHDYEALVAIHELVEYLLVSRRGITLKAIDEFDRAYEAARVEGDTSEPGDDPAAPYHREHVFAETVERLLAHELGVDWAPYSQTVEAL